MHPFSQNNSSRAPARHPEFALVSAHVGGNFLRKWAVRAREAGGSLISVRSEGSDVRAAADGRAPATRLHYSEDTRNTSHHHLLFTLI